MSWLRRWCDKKLLRSLEAAKKSNDELLSQLAAEHRRLEVAHAELESMALVIARDRQRVKAETSAWARRQAEAEGNEQHDRLSEPGI